MFHYTVHHCISAYVSLYCSSLYQCLCFTILFIIVAVPMFHYTVHHCISAYVSLYCSICCVLLCSAVLCAPARCWREPSSLPSRWCWLCPLCGSTSCCFRSPISPTPSHSRGACRTQLMNIIKSLCQHPLMYIGVCTCVAMLPNLQTQNNWCRGEILKNFGMHLNYSGLVSNCGPLHDIAVSLQWEGVQVTVHCEGGVVNLSCRFVGLSLFVVPLKSSFAKHSTPPHEGELTRHHEAHAHAHTRTHTHTHTYTHTPVFQYTGLVLHTVAAQVYIGLFLVVPLILSLTFSRQSNPINALLVRCPCVPTTSGRPNAASKLSSPCLLPFSRWLCSYSCQRFC